MSIFYSNSNLLSSSTVMAYCLIILFISCCCFSVDGFCFSTKSMIMIRRRIHIKKSHHEPPPPIINNSKFGTARRYTAALVLNMSSKFSMEEVPLNQIFQKAVVLQRSGDRDGALREYTQFLKVAESHDVDPSLYVSCMVMQSVERYHSASALLPL